MALEDYGECDVFCVVSLHALSLCYPSSFALFLHKMAVHNYCTFVFLASFIEPQLTLPVCSKP